MKESITFSLFADLHYKKGMYVASVEDLQKIFRRAEQDGSELVLHLGDMCNDYLHSPEITDAYLNNSQGLEVYGVYGNHELETEGNTMATVTPCLTNMPDRVVWGTENGKIGDGSIAYYYFDKDCFRFICLDSNYSKNPVTNEYEHNLPASWGAPSGNLVPESLGARQMKWLRATLLSAAKQEKRCIVLSHSSFSGLWQKCDDAEAVRAIFREANELRKGTVLLAVNGHLHTDHSAVIEDVLYLDVNTVRNGLWVAKPFYPYAEKDINAPQYTFNYIEYDTNGEAIASFERPLSSLSMGAQTLFYADSLSATVTLRDDGHISIKGSVSEWMYGIEPDSQIKNELGKISDIDL